MRLKNQWSHGSLKKDCPADTLAHKGWARKVAAEYNPLTKSITNLFSSVLGKDLAVPRYEEVQKGHGMSGKDISTGRRITTGVQGVSGVIGIGLGGASGVGSDMLFNGLGDGFDLDTKEQSLLNTAKSIYGFYKDIYEIKKQPMKVFLEFQNSTIGTTAELVDEKLKNKEQKNK